MKQRKSIRLKEYDYSIPGGYFVTICTHERVCYLGEIVGEKMQRSRAGDIVQRCWEEIPNHFENVELDAFIIMPNHIHGIIIITEPVGAIHESPLRMTRQERRRMMLPKIIGRFKMTTAKEINVLRKAAGCPVWQRNYYEHIIRDDRDLENIRDYIANNSLKWPNDNETLENFPL
jgi:putative transposase